MSESISLVDKEILKLILQHLDNNALGYLLQKAPLKQGVNILLPGASKNIRNKVIQILVAPKNLKYVKSAFETGKFNSFIHENYEITNKRYDFLEFKEYLKQTKGKAIDYLIFLLSEEGMNALNDLFADSLDNVKDIYNFFDESIFDIVQLNKKEQSKVIKEKEEVVPIKSYIKIQKEYDKLQTKYSKEIFRIKNENETIIQKEQNMANIEREKLIYNYENKLKEYKSELQSISQKLVIKNKQYKKSIMEINSLKENLRNSSRQKRLLVLVVGNLPENPILDEQRYNIITLATANKDSLEKIIRQYNFIKIYLQSEYVSTAEYLEIKKRYPTLQMDYVSRKNMEKEDT